MKTLVAELKHLYRNHEVWVWYIFLLGSTGLLISATKSQTYVVKNAPLLGPILIIIFIIGSLMGRLAADIWNKPFSFCMPGQIEAIRKMLMLIGFVTAIITSISMLFLFSSFLKIQFFSTLIILISFYSMIYFLSVIIAIRLNNLVFILLCFLMLVIPGIGRLHLLIPVQNMILDHCLVSTCTFGGVSYLIYRLLGSRYLPRSLSGVPWLNLFAEWEKSRLYRFKFKSIRSRQRTYTDKFAESLNNVFSKRILTNNQSLLLQHIWGRIYLIIGSMVSDWWRVLLVVFFLLIWVCFVVATPPQHNSGPYFFYILGIVSGQMCIMSRTDILIPLGRRERFFSGITALLTAISIMLVLFAAIVLLPKMLMAIYPLHIFERMLLQSKFILISVIVLPITGGLFILFRNKPLYSIIALTCMAIGLFIIHLYITFKAGYTFGLSELFIIILAIVVSMGFHIAVLVYDSMKYTFP